MSVLFCDVVSFTTLSAASEPEDLVALLNLMFSTFDQLTDKHKVRTTCTLPSYIPPLIAAPYTASEASFSDIGI